MGSCCKCRGPGYATPLDAKHNGPRETLLYVPAIVPDASRPDYLATVDADPMSATYSQVIHRLPMLYKGDELHHTGWNACSSCHDDPTRSRRMLILPGLQSGRVYAVDTATDPRAPRLEKVAEPSAIREKTGGLSYLHTAHCLGTGEIMISSLGDASGKAKGDFVLLDQDLKVKGTWGDQSVPLGYDFWYQPAHDLLASTSWDGPTAFRKGFDPTEVPGENDDAVYIWSWKEKTVKQTIHLGPEGILPLEIRFKHDPQSRDGFIGAASSSSIIWLTKAPDADEWSAKPVILQPMTKVEGWLLPVLPALITDILISLDDRFLYFTNWLRGDLVQYDITDPANPRLVGRVWLGGLIRRDGPLKVAPESLAELGLDDAPEIPTVKGHKLEGGPQMIQLSLDGKRLYVTNSLMTVYDRQVYPDMVEKGSYMLQIDVDDVKGGLSINPDFYVDFGAEPDGPVTAHEVRYPGGDCSSDIWL